MWFSRSRASVNLRPKQPGHATVPLSTFVVSVLALLCLFGGFWYVRSTGSSLSILQEQKSDQLIERVSMHVLVPTSEKPTIATVSDPEPLRGQPFFDHAEKGDKVLVYPNAKRAVLYRPSLDRVVEIMPFEPPKG